MSNVSEFCRVCGEHHLPGHCQLWEPVPHVQKAKTDHGTRDQVPEGQGQAAVAPDPWREAYDQARRLTPEDMKQEEMPVVRERFDRLKYQRELMKRRYWAAKQKAQDG